MMWIKVYIWFYGGLELFQYKYVGFQSFWDENMSWIGEDGG